MLACGQAFTSAPPTCKDRCLAMRSLTTSGNTISDRFNEVGCLTEPRQLQNVKKLMQFEGPVIRTRGGGLTSTQSGKPR